MNVSPSNSGAPTGGRRGNALRIGILIFAASTLGVLGSGAAQALGPEPDQSIRLASMDVYVDMVPAKALRGHDDGSGPQTVRDAVPKGSGVQRLTVSIFDIKTHARITDATVTASVTEFGVPIHSQKLDPSSPAGAVTFGNYYAMPDQGAYEVVVSVLRPGAVKPESARFQFWHLR